MSVNANPLLRLLLNSASPGNLPNTGPALPNPFTGAGGNNLVMGAANDLWPVLANNQLPLNVDQLLNLPNSGGLFTPVSPEQTQINLAALNNFLVNAGDNQTQSESLGEKLSRLVSLLTGRPNQPNAAPVNNNAQPVNDPAANNAQPANNQQPDPNTPQPVQDNKNNKDDKNNKNDKKGDKNNPGPNANDKNNPQKPGGPVADTGGPGVNLANKTYKMDAGAAQQFADDLRSGKMTKEQVAAAVKAKVTADITKSVGAAGLDKDANHAITKAFFKDKDGKGIDDGIDYGAGDTNKYTEAGAQGIIQAATDGAMSNITQAASAAPSASSSATASAAVNINPATSTALQTVVQTVQDGKKDDPFALDLSGKGVSTTNNTVSYDINGDGKTDNVNDIIGGVLTVDNRGDGRSGEDGKGLLGENTDLSRFGIQGKFKNGFDALKAIADNAYQRGIIRNNKSLDANDLQALERFYGLKVKTSGLNSSAVSLAAAGVSSIDLSDDTNGKLTQNFDGKGNDKITNNGGFTRTNGTRGGYADLLLQEKRA